MPTTEDVRNIFPLEWTEQDGQVVVTKRDGDRFVVKLNRAIEILNIADKNQFPSQVNLLNRILAEWLRDHASKCKDAYLTLRDGAFAFVVVRSAVEYDDDFEDELSTLDLNIARDRDLNLIKLNTLALPAVTSEALVSFLSPEFIVKFEHANRSGSRRTGE